jgi:hypothetical protein
VKNFLFIAIVTVCTALVSSDNAMAVVLGGGGGKSKSKARVVLENTEPANGIGIAAWIRPVGTPLPATLGAFRGKLIYMGPGETRQTAKLKNGAYTISIVNAAQTAGPANTPVNQNNLPQILGNQNFNINGNNRTANVSRSGVGFTN